MTMEQFNELPSAQREAMEKLVKDSGYKWEDVLKRAIAPSRLFTEIGIPAFHGMYVGIEPDGYVHT